MRSRHKTQNIDMKSGHLLLMTKVNILAFLLWLQAAKFLHIPDTSRMQVRVMSHFRAAKVEKKFHMPTVFLRFGKKS